MEGGITNGQGESDHRPLNERLADIDDAALLRASDLLPEAFGTIYNRHRLDLLRFLRARTRGETDLAMDLLAEVFAAAFEKRHTYDPDKGSVRGWLFGIAKNLLIDEWRHRSYVHSVRQRVGIPDIHYTDAALAEINALLEATDDESYVAHMERLPSDERDAVHARVIEDRTYGDIAAETQISQDAVRKRVSRGLARLRKRRPAP
jgi:RNA polymerase sigma factor (sigma-70 family)